MGSIFKSFSPKTDVSSNTAVKSSVQRGMRTKLLEQYPDTLGADDGVLLEAIWPKKESIQLVKFSREHVSIIVLKGTPLFFQHHDGPYLPTLHLLQKYPQLLPAITVDRGAIRFLLSGATIMAPGLTSAGGVLPPTEKAISKGTPVGVFAQGKESPLTVGLLKMDTEEIRKTGKGQAVENVHYLGDDLWKTCATEGL
ncbi:translation machinery-associated protein 20 [Tilletia horrida]|nr:translation machinery-associated protein 20 [Tilletia horrida]KAK0568458.1 translation machinery-associated protein 20 [Tilletia horrida]